MGTFRVKWIFSKVLRWKNMLRQAELLESVFIYYLAILAKLIPGLYTPAIKLRLKSGHSINIYEFMTLYIYHEIFVDKTYDVMTLAKSNPVIVDIGANTGLFALRMKQRYTGAQIFCYEPYPPNFRQLLATIEQNQLEDVTPIMKGVAGEITTRQLFVHPRNVGGHSLFQGVAGDSESSMTIELSNLPEVLSQISEHKIDLLKLDCEGAELEILRSISKDISEHIRNIVYEPTQSLYDPLALAEDLRAVGYRVRRDEGGLFVASYDDS